VLHSAARRHGADRAPPFAGPPAAPYRLRDTDQRLSQIVFDRG